jgi:hypothetical protein
MSGHGRWHIKNILKKDFFSGGGTKEDPLGCELGKFFSWLPGFGWFGWWLCWRRPSRSERTDRTRLGGLRLVAPDKIGNNMSLLPLALACIVSMWSVKVPMLMHCYVVSTGV